MNVYVNYNFCGYRWFCVKDLFQGEYVEPMQLSEWDSRSNQFPILTKLMIYDSYNLVYMKLNKTLVLALRHIRERDRTDIDGRKLLMTYIFEGSVQEREFFDKMAFTYIKFKDFLDEKLTSVIYSTLDSVMFDLPKMREFVVNIGKAGIIKQNNFHFGKGSVLLMLSKWRDDTISESLGIPVKEFAGAKYVEGDFCEMTLLENPDSLQCNMQTIRQSEEENIELKDFFKVFISDLMQVLNKKCFISEFCKKHAVILLICVSIISLLFGMVLRSCFE